MGLYDSDTPPLDHKSQRAKMRAADTDRDRAVEYLNVAYSEGRLSKDEYDERLGQALSARTYGDLDLLVTDLPAGHGTMVPPAADHNVPAVRTNQLAVASFACGLLQFVFGPLGTIPAIVLGHMARNQIKRTGEQGAGLAIAGLLLGWGAVVFGIIIITVAVASIHMQQFGPPSVPPPP
jgi:Domain of unknown function (DUF1707)/Domain of unknown function (DUF4190)